MKGKWMTGKKKGYERNLEVFSKIIRKKEIQMTGKRGGISLFD